jgi:methyl-accepting chemotaxis protein
MRPSFLRLRLSHKIGAIGAVGIVGVLTLGGIFRYGNAAQQAWRETADVARATSRSSDQAQIAMLEARRAEKDFLLRSDDKYVTRHGEVVRRAAAWLDELARNMTAAKQDELARRLTAVRQGLDAYVKSFARLAEARHRQGLDESSGLQGSLRKSVHAVEDKLAPVDDARLKAAMLTMRRHEKDFILRGGAKYQQDFLQAGDELGRLVESSELPADLKSALAADLDGYRKDFAAWVKGAEELAEAQRVLSQTYATIEPEIEALQKGVEDLRLGAETANEAARAATETQMQIAIVLIALVALVLAVMIGRAVTRPLSSMTDTMGALANGMFEVAVPGLGRQDEIGAVAAAVEVFKQQAIENSKQAERDREAERQAMEMRRQAILDMANTLEEKTSSAVAAIEATARQVDGTAQTMSQIATTVSGDTRSVAAASEEALATAETVSAAAEELSGSVREIGTQITRTAEVTRRAVETGEAAADKVRLLTDAVAKISAVTQLIGDVASQTNLLALNATIEAARAGEAGKGFAVVAAEVKGLAGQTARATEDINRQIVEIQAATNAAVGAMTEVGERIREIDAATGAIASTIEEQGAATSEIARNVSETAAASREVSAKIQAVNAGTGRVDGEAKNVRTGIGRVTDGIVALRHTLVQLVRTSTAEADRRVGQRHGVTAKADIAGRDGTRQEVEVVNLSEGGAEIHCRTSTLQDGDTATLSLRGLATPIRFAIRARDGEKLHVAFELSEADRSAYRAWLGRHVDLVRAS